MRDAEDILRKCCPACQKPTISLWQAYWASGYHSVSCSACGETAALNGHAFRRFAVVTVGSVLLAANPILLFSLVGEFPLGYRVMLDTGFLSLFGALLFLRSLILLLPMSAQTRRPSRPLGVTVLAWLLTSIAFNSVLGVARASWGEVAIAAPCVFLARAASLTLFRQRKGAISLFRGLLVLEMLGLAMVHPDHMASFGKLLPLFIGYDWYLGRAHRAGVFAG